MRAHVRAVAAVAVLSALGSFDRPPADPAPVVVPPAEARGVDGLPAPCGPGTLPEGPVCIPFGRAAPSLPGSPRIPAGATIPRHPDRPADLGAYLLPAGAPGPARAVEAYRSVELLTRSGERVALVPLEGEEPPAQVLFAGDLEGPDGEPAEPAVATARTVRDGSRLLTYLVILGRLDHVDPGVHTGGEAEAGAALGVARERLSMEVRLVRDGAKLGSITTRLLRDDAFSIPIDPRNALLRERASTGPSR
jgi:hypothetical protein